VSGLKEHKVSVDNKLHTIRLSRIDGETPFSVEIDGKPCRVELLNEPEFGKPFLVKINGRTYKVELGKFDENTPFFVRVNNKPYKVQYEIVKRTPASTRVMEPTLPISRKQPLSRPIVGRENAVAAPMPGIVVSLKVKVGDSVNVGQPLCILEAMKMENEITAPKAGVVKEIRVSEGSSVSQGQPIIIIE
jgi:glutaconyl-CoA decarboxylase